jgi:hypothetical protein
MSHTKKKATTKGKVSYRDLSAKKNPKGGTGLKGDYFKDNMLNPQPLPP